VIARASLVLAACILGTSCKSTVELEVRRLPVHVAIIPIAEPTIGHVTPGEFAAHETDLRLDLDCDGITRDIATALNKYCFERTTLLELDSAESGGAVDAFERERALLGMARERGADWILELALRYDVEVYRANTSTFWLNYPLFLFAGPSNWFIQDNAYFADVELTATIYDMQAIVALAASLGDPLVEVISISSRFGGNELDFIERSGGLLDYAKGILIPSGFLARESESAARAVHTDIVDALRAQIVRGLQSRRDDLVRMERVAPIFVEPSETRIERDGDALQVRGRVLLRDDGPARGVRAVHVEVGDERVSAEPSQDPGEGPAGYLAYPFHVLVPEAGDAGLLRLEVEAGSRDKFVRSYTFRISPDSGGKP
jgi:hypothetical protein